MSSTKDLDLRFRVDPTVIDLTPEEMDRIEGDVIASILSVVNDNNLGELAWLEIGGYAKFSKDAQ